MTIAELHGKISRTGTNAHDRLEDLLTSDVFGTFLYTEEWRVLGDWLGSACDEQGNELKQIFPGLLPFKCVGMKFWPTSLPREPDLVLAITGNDGNKYGICVEAKYQSGKSNAAIDEDEEEASDDDDEELGGEPEAPSGDQLFDQWRQIQKTAQYGWSGVAESHRVLLFITAHSYLPRRAFESTFAAGESTALEERLFWVSWRHLHDLLRDEYEQHGHLSGSKRMIRDLYELLERKALRWFRGYSHIFQKEGMCETFFGGGRVFWREDYFSFLRSPELISISIPVFWRQAR